jgi:negative regulator of flagellin synthesis FlgM
MQEMNSVGSRGPGSPWGLAPIASNQPGRLGGAGIGNQVATRPETTASPAAGQTALVRSLAASPPVDAGRVAALRAAIASGSYRIDADAIAGAMLAGARRG